MLHSDVNLDAARHAQDLRDTWQARVLAEAKGRLGAVVLSVLAHNFDDAMPVLLRVVFPGFTSIKLPFLVTAGKVAKGGQVCADVATKDGRIRKIRIRKMVAFFKTTRHMETEFRRLADRLHLSDKDRVEMFVAVRNWIVCDYRLDPSLDPADPGAKRLVH